MMQILMNRVSRKIWTAFEGALLLNEYSYRQGPTRFSAAYKRSFLTSSCLQNICMKVRQLITILKTEIRTKASVFFTGV